MYKLKVCHLKKKIFTLVEIWLFEPVMNLIGFIHAVGSFVYDRWGLHASEPFMSLLIKWDKRRDMSSTKTFVAA